MVNKKMLSVVAGGVLLMMNSCGTGSKAISSVDLAGEWNIVEVNGEKITAENLPYLGMDMKEKRIYGNAGCNRMMGSLDFDSIQPGKIHFASVATTRMMCPDMETERKVVEALDKVAGYEETKSGLSLNDSDGKQIMKLEKRLQPEVSVKDLEGEWNIVSVYNFELGGMEKAPFLAFNVVEKRVHGNAGCNVINGGFEQEADKASSLRFTQMISTMMSCPDMDIERQVLGALDKVRSFSLDENGTMLLVDGEGTTVITLSRK